MNSSIWSGTIRLLGRIADRLPARVADRLLRPKFADYAWQMRSSAGIALAEDSRAGYSRAQVRVSEAALELFSQHGVGGTSLQMIADALGVTKAAVYHQFKTKDEIVI